MSQPTLTTYLSGIVVFVFIVAVSALLISTGFQSFGLDKVDFWGTFALLSGIRIALLGTK